MDRIVWDDQALREIIVKLRRVSQELNQCGEEIRTGYHSGWDTLQKNTGESRRILEEIEAAMRQADRLAEQAALLGGAVNRAGQLMIQAETAAINATEALDHGETPTTHPLLRVARSIPGITLVTFAGMSEHITGIVPQWLRDAAEQSM